MKTKINKITLVTLLMTFLFLLFFVPANGQAFKRLKENDPMVSFTLKDMQGKEYSIDSYKGKSAVAVIFWSNPNLRSAAELGYLQKMYDKYHSEKGLEVLSVYSPRGQEGIPDSELDEALGVTVDAKISYPVLVDKGLAVYEKFGVVTIPSLIIIDKEGLVSALIPGFPDLSGERIVRRSIETALGIEQVVKKAPEGYQPKGKAGFYYNMALQFYKKGLISQALPKLETALKEDSTYADANILLGIFYSKKDELDKATNYFLAALDLDSSNMSAHYNYAIACKDGNRLAEAIKEFNIVIQNIPASADAYYGLGVTYLKNNDKVKAVESFTKALDLYMGSEKQKVLGVNANVSEVNPNKAYTHHGLAEIKQTDGKLDESVEEYKKANKEYKEVVGQLMKEVGYY
ncbi:MAG: tetratricopeptide repeat protein [bacterium]|nr:tetratricopeptide repeat protein [bacterium]